MSILTDLRQLLRDNDRAALEEALTTDTIRALLNVAEAVDAIDFYDDDEWHRMWIRVPEAKAALAPLVKEADDESDRIDEYDWRKDLEWLRPWTLGSSADQAKDRLAAYIERLEAERDALLAEHEAWTKWREGEQSTSRNDWNRLTSAHDNAERVMGGE